MDPKSVAVQSDDSSQGPLGETHPLSSTTTTLHPCRARALVTKRDFCMRAPFTNAVGLLLFEADLRSTLPHLRAERVKTAVKGASTKDSHSRETVATNAWIRLGSCGRDIASGYQ